MYTPMRTDEENVGIDRVAFGGINVYLQQRWAMFRHTPWAFDRLLEGPRLLRWVTGRGASVRPEHLGAAGGLDARRRAGPAAEGGRETGAMAGTRHPAGRCPPEQRAVDRRRPANHPPAGRRRSCAVCRAKIVLGKAARTASWPGPRRVAAAGGRSRRAGGDERLLCRVHGRVPSRADVGIRVVPPGVNLAGHGTRRSPAGPADDRLLRPRVP